MQWQRWGKGIEEKKKREGGQKKRDIESAPLAEAKLVILIWSDLLIMPNVDLMDEHFSISFWKTVQGYQFSKQRVRCEQWVSVFPCCGWSGLDWC